MAIGRVNTGGGGSGATLVITGVAGDTCTISKDGKSKSKTFGSDGKATFKGLDTGTWTVTMTNSSGSTATRTVTINADYTLTISYFSATIAVTYPAGSTCTCVNGSTTLTAVGTTGSYTFTVPNSGTWTVSCTDGTDTASESVSITADGQSKSVTLSYTFYLYDTGTKEVEFGNNGGGNGHSENWGTSYLTLSVSTSNALGYAMGCVYSSEFQQTSKHKTLKVSYESVSANASGSTYLVAAISTDSNPSISQTGDVSNAVATEKLSIKGMSNGSGTIAVDISEVTSNYTVVVGISNSSNGTVNSYRSSARITKIYLE